ncbi:MAG: hypothetical protein JSW70_08630, partial [Syntrophobacterales bacterium]
LDYGKCNLLASSENDGQAVSTFMLFGDPAMGVKVQATSTSSGPGAGCFVATAAYGSYAEEYVMVLREFRDRYLLPNALGSSLINLYYRCSPLLADFIQGEIFLRCIARIGLSPLVGASLVFARAKLGERWPLLIAIAVITSVLFYMELLIRIKRHQSLRTKLPQSRKCLSFSSTSYSGERSHRERISQGSIVLQ